MMSVFENMKMKEPKNQFTVGIVDDVTFTSLPILPEINVAAQEHIQQNSMDLVQTVQLVQIKTQLRLLVTQLINIARHILHTIQKNQEV